MAIMRGKMRMVSFLYKLEIRKLFLRLVSFLHKLEALQKTMLETGFIFTQA